MDVETFYKTLELKVGEYLFLSNQCIINFNKSAIERKNANFELDSVDYYEDIEISTSQYKTLNFWVGYNPKLEELRASPVEIVNNGILQAPCGRKSFFLHEYLKTQTTDYQDSNYLRGFGVRKQLIESIEKYFSKIRETINTKEIQKILNTDYWIDVPIDWGPYK